MNIPREQVVAEQLIREHVRRKIKEKMENQRVFESKLRQVIRSLIIEAETGTEEPSTFTGINVLADLLKNIIPTIADDYKMLTTSDEQRESFKNHIIHAVKNTLRPIEVNKGAEEIGESFIFEYTEHSLAEKVSMIVDDDEDPVEGEFIDIEDADGVDEDEFVQIADQNETGRNFAAVTFKAVEKQIVDAYDVLADEKDQDLFYDYLITNLLLYFDKFEDELQNTLPSISTAEYEKEKETSDLDVEEVPETDGESTSDAEELGLV